MVALAQSFELSEASEFDDVLRWALDMQASQRGDLYPGLGLPFVNTGWNGIDTTGVASGWANDWGTGETTYGQSFRGKDGQGRLVIQGDNNGLYGERPWQTTDALTIGGAIWGKSSLRIDGNTGLGAAAGGDRLTVVGKTKTTTLWVTSQAGIGADVGPETLTVTGTGAVTSKLAVGSSSVGTETVNITGTLGVASKAVVGSSAVGTETMLVNGTMQVSTRLGVGGAPDGTIPFKVTGQSFFTANSIWGTGTPVVIVDVTNSRLGVNTAGPSYALDVVGSARVDSPSFFVDSVNHRVGVGTITPSYALHVEGDAAFDINTSVPTFYVKDSTHQVMVLTTTGQADVEFNGAVRITAQTTLPTSGKGLELLYNQSTSTATIRSIDAGVATTNLTINGLSLKLLGAGTTRFEANGTGLGFFAGTPVAKQAITGTITAGTLAQLQTVVKNLLTALGSGATGYGLITDSTV